jgi:hypothetical protein
VRLRGVAFRSSRLDVGYDAAQVTVALRLPGAGPARGGGGLTAARGPADPPPAPPPLVLVDAGACGTPWRPGLPLRCRARRWRLSLSN